LNNSNFPEILRTDMTTLKEKLAKLDTDAEKRALVYKYALSAIKQKDSISKVAQNAPAKKPSFKDLYKWIKYKD